MGKNKDLIKAIIVLCAIALIAGILLGLFYQITFITDEEKEQQAITKLQKIYQSDSYEKIDFTSKDEELNDKVEYFFYDKTTGIYAIVASGIKGYKDKVPMYVIIKDNKIIALKEGAISETPGVSDAAFDETYLGKFLKPIDELNFTDTATGATYSKKGVVSSIENAVKYYKEYIASAKK